MNREIKDRRLIDEILSGSDICRLGMNDGGRPYILPFNYGYRENCIYIHSAPEGKKIELLRKNSHVCFEIESRAEIIRKDIPCDWSESYRSVIGYANVEIVGDEEGKIEGLDIIMSHYGFSGKKEYRKGSLDQMVILKLNITELTAKQSADMVGS